MRTCTAYRRRGPATSACMDLAPSDLCPSTGCEDVRRFDSYARGIRGGACPVNATVCA